jgi:hypothetical protein
MKTGLLSLLMVLLSLAAQARGDSVLLLEEPYGHFGSWNPTGHAAVYLTQVCAASPTKLRRCEPGEAGVVISRYHRVAGFDWIAVPLIAYLYAVETVQEIPESANAESVAQLRDLYRREHLLALAPDDTNGNAPKGDWYQLVGSAYDRTLYGFRISTTTEQDDAFIDAYNNRDNKTRYSLLRSNCADFTREVLNFYAPHSIHRSLVADLGITTPKQVAKSLAAYSKRHPELSPSIFRIPQVPGDIRRSKPANGVVEGLLKTKKYMLPLAVLHPVITAGLAATYFMQGRFNPHRDAAPFDIAREIQPAPADDDRSTSTTSSAGMLSPAPRLKGIQTAP